MTRLRVGTRGSELALIQTRWVCQLLRIKHPSVTIDELIIKTHGDVAKTQLFSDDWPSGGFTGAIEQALVQRRIDFAVHSFKDLPTAATLGLTVAAVPPRESANDVLVTRRRIRLDGLPAGLRIGTSSPRRTAQLRRLADVHIVPVRGNVPTRIAQVETELDGVVVAAAGLRRLGLDPPHRIDLPLERFPTAPAQGALAVQVREEEANIAELLATLDDAESRRAVMAERAFLQAIGAGCQTPVGATAVVEGGAVSLRGQIFSEDGRHVVEGVERGEDGSLLGRRLAERLMRELARAG